MSPLVSRMLQLLELVLLQAAVLFISAGDLRWSAGWWYLGLYVALLICGAIFLIPRHPAVIHERSKGTAGAKRWDLWITRLIALPTLGTLVVAGLDERLSWTNSLPIWSRVVGGFLFTFGYVLVLWAMSANQYFSQGVRIQTERGHITVTNGPYHVVRHPGYLGMLASLLGAVLLLDSLWGLVCFLVYLGLIIARTILEDRTLLAELSGYPEFAARTRYRLLPGVW